MTHCRIALSSFLTGLLLLAGFASPSYAQTAPKLEASGGYQYLHAPELSLPTGWYADVALRATPLVSIVGDISHGGRTDSVAVTRTQNVDISVGESGYFGGARLSLRFSPKVVPYFQALAGAARVSAGAPAGVTGAQVNVSETRFALQTGSGVSVMVSPRVGVRFAADSRLITLSETDGGGVERDLRFVMGVVFTSGK